MSIDGMLGLSAGRATGRPPPSGLDGFEAGVAALVAAPRLTAERLPSSRPARFKVMLRLLVGFLLAAFFDEVDLALVRLVPPRLPSVRAARLAVMRLLVDRDFVVDRLAVDFFVDFFLAAIDPPFGCAIRYAQGDVLANDRRITCDL
ncbi:MAG: hypothetical protein E6I88_05835 [Chloroflexi bacterium]|nr:MAG: hypothetical protein E6I88_05835 [Chloroflexota bacterium]TME45042.1 MAG: hypothetical protein E6I56_10415 [Chloroflexota bacterium]